MEPFPLWTFWADPEGTPRPGYIDLCLRILNARCPGCIVVDPVSVQRLLPDLRTLEGLRLCHQVDYIRVALLVKYGGLWLDADTLLCTDPRPPVAAALRDSDYVGFGASDLWCTSSGSPRPSNWAMASRPGGRLVTALLAELDRRLDTSTEFTYFELGKLALWKVLDDLRPTGYTYSHFPAAVDGTRDRDGAWISTSNHLARVPTPFLDPTALLFICLENHVLATTFYKDLSPEDILFADTTWLSSLFRSAVGLAEHWVGHEPWDVFDKKTCLRRMRP